MLVLGTKFGFEILILPNFEKFDNVGTGAQWPVYYNNVQFKRIVSNFQKNNFETKIKFSCTVGIELLALRLPETSSYQIFTSTLF